MLRVIGTRIDPVSIDERVQLTGQRKESTYDVGHGGNGLDHPRVKDVGLHKAAGAEAANKSRLVVTIDADVVGAEASKPFIGATHTAAANEEDRLRAFDQLVDSDQKSSEMQGSVGERALLLHLLL
jgi:hypothetical protein